MFKAMTKSITFWLAAAACLLALVGFILAIVTNSVQGYSMSAGGGIIAMSIIGVLCVAVSVYLSHNFGGQHFLTNLARLAAVVLLGVSLALIVDARVADASALFTWDPDNTVGWSAFGTGVAAVVLDLLSVILLIVCGFIDGDKKAE